MKLEKPIITICLIILLGVDLIFFSFLFIGKKAGDQDYLEEIVLKFDAKKYVLNNDLISSSINNYKYPKEVFDYIDYVQVNIIKKKYIYNLIHKKETLILKDDIKGIVDNSVYEYESRYSKDIYNYVKDDIEYFSNNATEKLNNEIKDAYYSFNNFSSGIVYYASIVIALLSVLFILWIEKKTGILINGIILLLYSFYVYYFNNNFLSIGFNSMFKYFDDINLKLENLYIICFIISFVLLLIYIIDYLRRKARDIRINSYYRR